METVWLFLCWLLAWLRIIPKPDLLARLVSDHPDPETMKAGMVYIVGGNGYWKWAYLRCPSKHDEIIQLSLMQERRPRWQITADRLGRPTVHPSIRQLEGSYAHFWIKNGRIEWCRDSGRKPMSG
jgi:Family of unknown function (DUF6527)